MRRISGRHQISADGKHLIDGVAFGRPYLRRPARPAVRIAPRKRRRIADDEADENDDDDEELTDQQMLLTAGYSDADEFRTFIGNDEDEEFSSDDEGDEGLGAELEDLQSEVQTGANEDTRTVPTSGVQEASGTNRRRSQRSPKGLGLLKLVDENGQPFVGKYDNPLLDEYGQLEPPALPPIAVTRKRRSRHHAQENTKHAPDGIQIQRSSANLKHGSRRISAGSNKSVHFEDDEAATPATVRESQSSDEEDDGDFIPSEADESDKENAEPLDGESYLGDVCKV